MGRLNALAAAYALLTRDRWTEVPLRDVLLQELQPFLTNDGENVVIAGDRISLKPRGALAFGMIVHEFTTNAVKHGALSVPGGKLTIRWEAEARDGGEWLVWNWIERDGPPVTPRDRRGFGLMMIERGVDHELKGNAQIAFDAAGLRAMLAIPLAPGLVRRAVERAAQ